MAFESDESVLQEIGARIRQERLNQNRTQADVADAAGLSVNVIKSLESGRGSTLGNFARILRALGKIAHVDLLLPPVKVSPVQLAKMSGRMRKEATGGRGRARKGE